MLVTYLLSLKRQGFLELELEFLRNNQQADIKKFKKTEHCPISG